jgi:hypothetical protein
VTFGQILLCSFAAGFGLHMGAWLTAELKTFFIGAAASIMNKRAAVERRATFHCPSCGEGLSTYLCDGCDEVYSPTEDPVVQKGK